MTEKRFDLNYGLNFNLVWTNWTFGVWYGRFRKWKAFGVDLGPCEWVYRWPR